MLICPNLHIVYFYCRDRSRSFWRPWISPTSRNQVTNFPKFSKKIRFFVSEFFSKLMEETHTKKNVHVTFEQLKTPPPFSFFTHWTFLKCHWIDWISKKINFVTKFSSEIWDYFAIISFRLWCHFGVILMSLCLFF